MVCNTFRFYLLWFVFGYFSLHFILLLIIVALVMELKNWHFLVNVYIYIKRTMYVSIMHKSLVISLERKIKSLF